MQWKVEQERKNIFCTAVEFGRNQQHGKLSKSDKLKVKLSAFCATLLK